jgi:drug/metabolite transporter (DMT)-like permease
MAKHSIVSRRVSFLGYGACALAGCLWGTGFYFGRLALNEMSVEHMVLYRFLFASLGMLPVVLMNWRRFRLTGGELRLLLLSAAFGIPIQFLLQFHGLALTTVSHASLMVGAMPVLLAAAAALFAAKGSHEERLDWLGWLALTGSTVGAALIVLGGSRGTVTRGQPSLVGDLLVVASLITALAWILLSKKLMENGDAGRADPRPMAAESAVASHYPPSVPAAALRAHKPHRLGSAGHQRTALYSHDHAALELGHPPCAGLARRRLPEH